MSDPLAPPPLQQAPPVLPAEFQPPAAPRPWGPWPTAGLSLAAIGVLIVVQSIVCIACLVATTSRSARSLDLSRLVTGDSLTIATLATAPILTAFLWFLAWFRRPYPIRAHLGLRPFNCRQTALGMGWLIAYLGVFALVEVRWPESPNPTMALVYHTASSQTWLSIAIVLVAPFYEELLFRGFLLEGLIDSPLGKWGAAGVSSLAFTAIHAQYGLREWVQIFVLGVLLGALRIQSRSIGPGFIAHAVNNAVAGVMYLTYLSDHPATP